MPLNSWSSGADLTVSTKSAGVAPKDVINAYSRATLKRRINSPGSSRRQCALCWRPLVVAIPLRFRPGCRRNVPQNVPRRTQPQRADRRCRLAEKVADEEVDVEVCDEGAAGANPPTSASVQLTRRPAQTSSEKVYGSDAMSTKRPCDDAASSNSLLEGMTSSDTTPC